MTSLFTDPCLYGRHVVLTGVPGAALGGQDRVALAAPLMVLLFAGLYFSYSQSSMAALFVVAAAAVTLVAAGDRTARRAVLKRPPSLSSSSDS